MLSHAFLWHGLLGLQTNETSSVYYFHWSFHKWFSPFETKILYWFKWRHSCKSDIFISWLKFSWSLDLVSLRRRFIKKWTHSMAQTAIQMNKFHCFILKFSTIDLLLYLPSFNYLVYSNRFSNNSEYNNLKKKTWFTAKKHLCLISFYSYF